jgi:hypothetical protein
MKPYRILIHFMFVVLFLQNLSANDFEGNISIVKETHYDTSFYYLTVFKNMVRIDQKNAQKIIVQSLIVNLDDEKIIALSPIHKLYTNVQTQPGNPNHNAGISVNASQNYKIINGFKCFQWRVRNEGANSEISYWVCNSEYHLFKKLIRILNSTEDYSNLFTGFTMIDNETGIPILSVDRTLLREEKSRITVSNLKNCKVDPRIFDIPKDYKMLRF